jgi:hypothetical protein
VLAGDLNLYYSAWDEFNRTTEGAEVLINIAEQKDLLVRTPRGAITRAPQGQQRGRTSTIDLFLVFS